ncbi:hypothetical protein HYV81_06475 [Candidatus Woesearchaeota archaeon]|nr:hypothetical protein [Candidatus Woesearchaeota archaeon]
MIHKPLTYHEASGMLEDVHEGKHFRTKEGATAKNLHELYDVIRKMGDAEFSHHLNADKNDFREWVHHAVQDYDLAQELGKCKSREQVMAKLEKRLDHLHLIRHGPVIPHKLYMDYALYDFLGGIIVGLMVGLVVATLV